MRKSLKLLLSAGIIALGAGATLGADPAEARTRVFLGIGLPPIYFGPPAYYYPPPPPPPPPYYQPAPAYAPPPPCRPRYDWRWDGYQWRQAYVGCW
jgi:hypothetical protein